VSHACGLISLSLAVSTIAAHRCSAPAGTIAPAPLQRSRGWHVIELADTVGRMLA